MCINHRPFLIHCYLRQSQPFVIINESLHHVEKSIEDTTRSQVYRSQQDHLCTDAAMNPMMGFDARVTDAVTMLSCSGVGGLTKVALIVIVIGEYYFV